MFEKRSTKVVSLCMTQPIKTEFRSDLSEHLIDPIPGISVADIQEAKELLLIEESEIDSINFESNPTCVYRVTPKGMSQLKEENQNIGMEFTVTSLVGNHSEPPLIFIDPSEAWRTHHGVIHVQEIVDEVECGPDIPAASVSFCSLSIPLFKKQFPSLNPFDAERDLYGYDPFDEDIDFIEQSGIESKGELIDKIIVLLSIEVRAPFIGLGLGADIISKITDRYGGRSGLIILSPFPMQFNQSSEREDINKTSFGESLQKIKSYYSKIGFFEAENNKEIMMKFY